MYTCVRNIVTNRADRIEADKSGDFTFVYHSPFARFIFRAYIPLSFLCAGTRPTPRDLGRVHARYFWTRYRIQSRPGRTQAIHVYRIDDDGEYETELRSNRFRWKVRRRRRENRRAKPWKLFRRPRSLAAIALSDVLLSGSLALGSLLGMRSNCNPLSIPASCLASILLVVVSAMCALRLAM